MSEVRAQVMPGAQHVIPFHFMMSGSCWIETDDPGIAPIRLDTGDVILLPNGEPHYLGSVAGHRAQPDLSHYYRPTNQQLPFRVSEIGGGGEPARLVCGYFGCDATPFNPLLGALPPVTVIRRASGSELAQTFITTALGVGNARKPGGEIILAKLSELMLVQAIRLHIETLSDGAEGWLGGLRDPMVGRALQLIHADPSREWTLASLSRETGLSRSALAERFVRLVKLPPMQYLARWRMQLAAHALEQPSASIAVVAADVGYQSEAAFNRAFKRFVGVPPGLWRRAHPPGRGVANTTLQSPLEKSA
jgi:AraC-like DNA-binding protein